MTSAPSDSAPAAIDEAIVDRFEAAWQREVAPALESYLPNAGERPTELVAELVHIDLEYRLKTGHAARVEEYVNRFPELSDVLIELVETEFRFRRRLTPSPTVEEYFCRFPTIAAQLKERFGGVDATAIRQLPPVVEGVATRTFGAARPETESPPRQVGRFQVLELLGEGTFGTVHRARDTELMRDVAIKLPRYGAFATKEEADRFVRDARNAAHLHDPGIVSIFEVGRAEQYPYIVMEHIQGATLSSSRHQLARAWRRIALVAAQIGDALQYAHAHGVVHRDLKPANIMLTPDGRPRILDFGLARREAVGATLTAENQVLGTPAYMSPEQASGESHRATGLSDQYSLGVILYELLTGELPFRGNARMILRQVLEEEPHAPRRLNDDMPRDLETICLKAMQKDPSRRYAMVAEMSADLRRFLAGEPIHARPTGRFERGVRWCHRNRVVAILLGTIGATLSLGLAGVSWQWWQKVRAEQGRVAAQVDGLVDVHAAALSHTLDELAPHQSEVVERLQDKASVGSLSVAQELRLRLALLPGSPREGERLAEIALQNVAPADFLVLRERVPRSVFSAERLWAAALDGEAKPDSAFRASALLTRLAPSDARWSNISTFVAGQLLREGVRNADQLGQLAEMFQPPPASLFSQLQRAMRDNARPEQERWVAAWLLARFVDQGQSVEPLATVLADCPAPLLSHFTTVAANHTLAAQSALENAYDRATGALEGADLRGAAVANLAIGLARLDAPSNLWKCLQAVDQPAIRAQIIDRLRYSGVPAEQLITHLRQAPQPRERAAVYLALANYLPDRLTELARRDLGDQALASYRTDSRRIVHGAARALLIALGSEAVVRNADSEMVAPPAPHREWYVESDGQTCVVLPPGDFTMGSPLAEPDRARQGEEPRAMSIPYAFALGACEVTVGQFQRFRGGAPRDAYDPQTDPQTPVRSVLWSEAAAYCNWLTRQAGLDAVELCYEVTDHDKRLLRPVKGFLDRHGYRLPTEAEWEYACRAGSADARFFGESAELLPTYAWTPHNASDGRKRPVGRKFPNEFGLFDMYGNAAEWCNDVYLSAAASPDSSLSGPPYDDDEFARRVLRGQAAGDVVLPRSALRDSGFYHNQTRAGAELRFPVCGFRVARTLAR